MANTLTPTDVYAIVNAMAAEMYGTQNSLQAINTSTFATVGEAMLRTGYENTVNALSAVIGRTIIAARPYRGKFRIIMKVPQEFGLITRKISFYSGKLEPSTDFNTDLNPAQIVDGGSIDPWKITKTYPLEINFTGLKVMQKNYTVFRYQLKQAFQGESNFSTFVSGLLIQIANDLEVAMDAENRLQVLNAIGATYNTGAGSRQAVNLTAEYNAFYNTSYTTAQLLTTYYKELMQFFVMRIKGDMELMSENNSLFHLTPAKNDDAGNALTLNRHTPPDMRRLLLYMPMIRQAESSVFPSLFNDSYLKLENYEGVEYWQNPNVPAGIDIVPHQLDVATGAGAAGKRVQLDNVVALLFDRDALVTSVHVEDVITSPINNRGSYYNVTYHYGKDYQLDQTENMILYYMEDVTP